MDYPIRNLDPETWTRFRTRCAREGTSARSVLLEFIASYAAERFQVARRQGGTRTYLTALPGILTSERALAESFSTLEEARAAIETTRPVLGPATSELFVLEAQ